MNIYSGRKIRWVAGRPMWKAICMLLLLVLAACDGTPAPVSPPPVTSETTTMATTTSSPVVAPAETDTPEVPPPTPTNETIAIAVPTDTPPPQPTDMLPPQPTNTQPPQPTDTPTSAPTNTIEPTATTAPLFYNLPPAMLTSATGLYASPNRAELIVPVSIPAGETVYVMGRNATSSHLRVVWSTGVGWVPISFTDYNGRRDRIAPLPIFTREPPACAIPITTQFGLSSTWASTDKQRIAVVVDLFRSRYGDFPRSSLSLTVNGKEVETSRRQIVEQGQFSLKDVVFSLPQDVQPGDAVGYLLQTSSDEPLTFMATIFSVPSNCKWKLD